MIMEEGADGTLVDPSTTAHPVTEEDWIIHAVNIQGVFFERMCRKIIEDTPRWHVTATNLPVEAPPPSPNTRGKESNLDIRAEIRLDGRDGYQNILTLLVECKKNNPDFVKWLFFPKHKSKLNRRDIPITDQVNLHQVWIEYADKLPDKYGVFPRVSRKGLSSSLHIADEAREVRGNYSSHKNPKDKTKTANAAISEAAYQVALATQAIFQSETAYLRSSFDRAKLPNGLLGNLPWARQIFVPAIVTSARLYTCDFDPADVNVASGEIPFEKAAVTEHKYLLYEYPLPRHLQTMPQFPEVTKAGGDYDLFNRMQIFVVHSGHLSEFIKQLAQEDFWTFV